MFLANPLSSKKGLEESKVNGRSICKLRQPPEMMKTQHMIQIVAPGNGLRRFVIKHTDLLPKELC